MCSAPSCLTLLTPSCPCWTKRREAQPRKCSRSLDRRVSLVFLWRSQFIVLQSFTTRSLDPPLGSFSAPVLSCSLSGSGSIGPEAPGSFTAVQLEVLESLACEISLPAYPESSLPWSYTGKRQGRTAGERTNYHKSWPFKIPRMNWQMNCCVFQVCGRDSSPVSSWSVPWRPCSGSSTTPWRSTSACPALLPPRCPSPSKRSSASPSKPLARSSDRPLLPPHSCTPPVFYI